MYTTKITRLGEVDLPTSRILFRKIAKGINEKDFVIAEQELRIQQLEAKVQQLEPRKRRKVKLSPNSKFAGIEAIIRAQIEAGDREIEVEESDTAEDSDSTLSCIEVED